MNVNKLLKMDVNKLFKMDVNKLLKRGLITKRINSIFGNSIKYVLKSPTSIIIIDNNNILHELNVFSNLFFYNVKNFNPFVSQSIKSMFTEFDLNEEIRIDKSYGFLHFFAITEDQKIYGWGNNFKGQLGNGRQDIDEKNYNQLELNSFLSDLKITSIQCGSFHSLALTLDGQVYAWGDNSLGQIGNASRNDQNIPVKIVGFNGEILTMISCGKDYSMACSANGHVFGWGCNGSGQLGDIDEDVSDVPVKINLSGIVIKKISCGPEHSLLLSNEGKIYALGNNCCGQIGNKNKQNQRLPFKLNHEKIFIDITCHWSKNISIAYSSDEIYYAWGECGNEDQLIPLKTRFKSANELFDHYFYYNLCLTDKLTKFENGFMRDEFYRNNFDELEKLGEGSFGIVFKVLNKKQCIFKTRDKTLAVKKITFKKLKSNRFMKELKLFLVVFKLSRVYVVEHLRIWFENISNDKMIFYIAMQLCDRSLQQIIEVFGSDPKWKMNKILASIRYYIASQLFIEIIECVQYLHDKEIIHRDLSPNNIMLKIDKESRRCIKIIDFGLIAIHELAEPNQEHSPDVGAVMYQAPEVRSGRNYDTKADVYSLGLIFGQLFFLDDIRSSEDMYGSTILNSEYQIHFNLFQRMTHKYPQQRPDCKEILNERHLWAINGEIPALRDLLHDFSFQEENNILINLLKLLLSKNDQ